MPWRKYRAEISCEDFPSTFCPWIVHSGVKEPPDCNGQGVSYVLKSGDFMPKYGWRECEGVGPVGNQQKWDTFVKERSGGDGRVLGLPEQAVVALAAS